MGKAVVAICEINVLDVGGWQWKEGWVEPMRMPWVCRISRCSLAKHVHQDSKQMHVRNCDGSTFFYDMVCGVANIDESILKV
jgi:hypothetical protein